MKQNWIKILAYLKLIFVIIFLGFLGSTLVIIKEPVWAKWTSLIVLPLAIGYYTYIFEVET